MLSLIKNNNNLEYFDNLSIPNCYLINNSKITNLPSYIYLDNCNIIDNDKFYQLIEIVNINKTKNKNKTKKITKEKNKKTKKK